MSRAPIRLAASALALTALGLGGLLAFTAITAARIERNFPPRGKFVEIDGARVHYLDEGTGPVLVFIHGLGGQMGNFTHSLVERLTADYRVIVMERPGSGHSHRPDSMLPNIRAQAAFVAKFIDALGLDRPTIVGHSLGGAIALALALDAPENIGALALIAPLTQVQEHVPEPFTALMIASPLVRSLVAWTIAIPASIRRRDAVLDALFGPDVAPNDFGTRGGGFLSLLPRSFIGASTDLVAANTDLREMVMRYGSIELPVAVLFGTDDRVLDARVHGERLAAMLPSAKLTLVPGGHMLPVSAPDQTAQWIRLVTSAEVR